MEAGVIGCVAGGRDVGSGDGVEVVSLEFVIDICDGVFVILDSASGTLEHPTVIINRDNTNNRLIWTCVF